MGDLLGPLHICKLAPRCMHNRSDTSRCCTGCTYAKDICTVPARLSNIQKSGTDMLHLAVLMGGGIGGAPFCFSIKFPPALT